MSDKATRQAILDALEKEPGIGIRRLAALVYPDRRTSLSAQEWGELGATLTRMQLEGQTQNWGEGFAVRPGGTKPAIMRDRKTG